jgi:hypothetical protein
MDEYLKFGNDEIIPGKARESGNNLFVYLYDTSMDDALALLTVPENMETVIYHYYKVELTFTGYTKLAVANNEGYRISAMLEKDGANNGAE